MPHLRKAGIRHLRIQPRGPAGGDLTQVPSLQQDRTDPDSTAHVPATQGRRKHVQSLNKQPGGNHPPLIFPHINNWTYRAMGPHDEPPNGRMIRRTHVLQSSGLFLPGSLLQSNQDRPPQRPKLDDHLYPDSLNPNDSIPVPGQGFPTWMHHINH
jgi:hypothetical protein